MNNKNNNIQNQTSFQTDKYMYRLEVNNNEVKFTTKSSWFICLQRNWLMDILRPRDSLPISVAFVTQHNCPLNSGR